MYVVIRIMVCTSGHPCVRAAEYLDKGLVMGYNRDTSQIIIFNLINY